MKLRPYWTAAYSGDDSNTSSIGKGTVTNTIAGRMPQVVLWAELPGAEIRHLPGRTAIASPAELGRTAAASGTSSIM